MKILRKAALSLAVLITIPVLFVGGNIAYKYYLAHQRAESLNGTALGAELSPAEIEGGQYLSDGELLSKRAFELSDIEPIWSKLIENGALKKEYAYLDKLDFFAITYKSDSLLINGIIAEPKAEGVFPVVLFNRGGNKKTGNDAKFSTLFSLLTTSAKLASEGYVILASCYRGETDEFGGRDINDVLDLAKTAHELPKANANRIGMLGWSRGGMMTYLALQCTDYIKTAVVGNGPTDLAPLLEERPEMESVCARLIPNFLENREQELKKRSAVYWADELDKNSSLLILCGTNDENVNPNQAHKLAAELEKINYNFTLKEFKTDHKFTGKKDELNAALISWFGKRL
jgi:dipeptidyl aminopeptidase/acylaminoacyl peptidase